MTNVAGIAVSGLLLPSSSLHKMPVPNASRLLFRGALLRNATKTSRLELRSLHATTDTKKSLADKYTEKLEQAAKECEVFRGRVYPL